MDTKLLEYMDKQSAALRELDTLKKRLKTYRRTKTVYLAALFLMVNGFLALLTFNDSSAVNTWGLLALIGFLFYYASYSGREDETKLRGEIREAESTWNKTVMATDVYVRTHFPLT